MYINVSSLSHLLFSTRGEYVERTFHRLSHQLRMKFPCTIWNYIHYQFEISLTVTETHENTLRMPKS